MGLRGARFTKRAGHGARAVHWARGSTGRASRPPRAPGAVVGSCLTGLSGTDRFVLVTTKVFTNARIITVDDERPAAEAVVVRGNRFAFVGSSEEAVRHAGDGAERHDLGGRTVVPGFNDNHVHALVMGDVSSQIDLAGLNEREIVAKLTQHYPNPKPGRLIVGHGWDYPSCPNPHKDMLDEAFPNNPVVLIQFSGHGGWVNSRMLEKLGITRGTPNPTGGTIVKDSSGELTGILYDTAISGYHNKRFIKMHLNRKLSRQYLASALREFRSHGITSVQDNTWIPTTLTHLNRMKRRGDLTCRFTCWAYGPSPFMARLFQLWRFDQQWVRRGPWKYFLDGTFSTRTAWMTAPYAGEPSNFGTPIGGPERFEEIVDFLARRRRQGAFHAIGDRAVQEFINAVERVRERRPQVTGLRLRLEHAQLVRPEDVPRLRDLGILIAAQPHAMADPDKDIGILGEQRAGEAYPYRRLIDGGVHLSFGSDIPGEATFNPVYAIHMAVNRDAKRSITPFEALKAYTLESAYAEFMEHEKGSITKGKLADFAVLDSDITRCDPAVIGDTSVEMTVVNGDIVYERGGS